MKHTALFRFLSMLTVLFYTVPLTYAGQVITQTERSWAQDAMKHEASLGAVSSPNSIAVLYFNNKTGVEKLDALQKGMAVMLITDLAKIEQFQVVERVWLQALLDEMDLGTSGLMDVKTIPTVGNLLGAYYVVSGNIQGHSAQNLEIDSSILDIPLQTVTQQPAAKGDLEELFKLEKTVLFNIVDQMNVTLSPEKRTELEQPLSASTAALLALFVGIDLSDKKQYTDAAQMYKQALIEDPNLQVAKSALQELEGMGLVSVEEAVPLEKAAAEAAAVEAGGSSTGIIVGVGLAIAAGVGVAVALGSSSSDSNDSPTLPTLPTDNDTTALTVAASPAAGSSVSCAKGSIYFTFSKAMDTSKGQASISPKNFASGDWSGQQYVVTWPNSTSECSPGYFPTSLSITMGSSFQDTTGSSLTPATFGYTIE